MEVINALRDQVDEYKEIFGLLPIGLYRTSIEDGTFLKANEYCAKMFGYNSVDKFMVEVKAPELYVNSKVRKRFISELMKNGVIENYELKLNLPKNCLCNNTCKAGDIVWVAITAMLNREEGWLQGSMMCISNRKLMEIKLNKFQEQETASLKVITEAAKIRSTEIHNSNGNGFIPKELAG
jgi:PAS domain-containing protein